MNSKTLSKFFLLFLIFLPQLLAINIKRLFNINEPLQIPYDSLLFSSIIFLGISTQNIFISRNSFLTTYSRIFNFMGVMLTVLASTLYSMITIFNLYGNDVQSISIKNIRILIIIMFLCSLLYFLLGDYWFGKLEDSEDSTKIIFEIDEEHKINLNKTIDILTGFLFTLPQKLLISTLITCALFVIYKYESNITNHLTVLGGVIAITTLFKNKGTK